MVKIKPLYIFAFMCALYLMMALMVESNYYQLILTIVLVWICFSLSWNVFSGYCGLLSFGHAAFFGLGAYTTVLAQVYLGVSPWLSIPASGLIGAFAGLMIGIPTFRLRGHYFAFATLAYPLALLYVFQWLGFQEVTFDKIETNAWAYMQFDNKVLYTAIALFLLILFVLVTRYIELTRFGSYLAAIKQNEPAAQAAGIDTYKWKLKALMLSGGMAGMVGGFYAVVILVVTADSVFGMLVSAQALTVAVFGGIGTFWGPIVGGLVLLPLGEFLQAEFGSVLPGLQGVVLGVAIIIIMLSAREGIVWKARDLYQRGRQASSDMSKHGQPATDAVGMPSPERPDNDPHGLRTGGRGRAGVGSGVLLRADSLYKHFGGLKAINDVSFDVHRGEILGVIGPNGAGKTTLFNTLNGFVKPDGGNIFFDGNDVTGNSPHDLCIAGIGRTFQIMRPFMRLNVEENVKVGAYLRAGSEADASAIARRAVDDVGLTYCAGRSAQSLTTKEMRLMELARALATGPKLLLLDETLAGLGKTEVSDVMDVLYSLSSANYTIVIIEHTMHAMVQLVDRLLVLDHGHVVTQAEPASVTRDERVIEAYLGKKWKPAYA